MVMRKKGMVIAGCLIYGILGMQHVAHAANECKVKYGYHTIKNGKRTDHTAVVNLNVNQSKNINTARMNYVSSLKEHKVYVDLSGAGVIDVTLGKNQANPAAGFYLVPVTLKSLKCLNETSAPAFGTPAALINAFQQANKSVSQITQGLKDTFNLGGQQITQLLKAAGYTTEQIIGPLKNTFNANITQVTGWLKAAGYSGSQVIAALKSSFNATAQQASSALKSHFNANAQQMAQWLKQAGYAGSQVTAALKSTFNSSAQQITPILKDTFNANATQIAQWLKAAGYSAGEVITALREQFNISLGTARNLLGNVYRLSGQAADQILTAAGYVLQQARSGTERAVSGAIKLRDVEHGDRFKSCNSFSNNSKYGVRGLPALPMPNDSRPHRITINATGPVATVSSIRGLPPGARVSIIERGSCYLVVEFRIPRNLTEGRTGRATLRVGNANGPGFNWVIGRIPSPATGRGYASVGGGSRVTRGNQGNTNSTPDLVPSFSGRLFRHLTPGSRRVDQSFCQNLPVATGTTASTAEITVPNITWGVINNANVHAVSGNFRVSLSGSNNQVLGNQLVTNMGSRASQTFTYMRPQSRTRVILITPTTNNTIRNVYGGVNGCYQMQMSANDVMNWQDPVYRVVVDTENSISETSEINNQSQY